MAIAQVCAVKINLHELLLENRKESVDEGFCNRLLQKGRLESTETANLNRIMLNLAGGNLKSKVGERLFKDWKNTGRSQLQ